MPTDENVFRILTSRAPTVKAAQPAEVEWNDLQDRVQVLEDNPPTLDELPDVDLSGLVDGDMIAYDEASDTWVRVPIIRGIERVYDNYGQERSSIQEIGLGSGLRIYSGSPATGLVVIQPVFGASGSANVAAREDHRHPLTVPQPLTFAASGTLSGGTRTLASGTISGLNPANTYTIGAEVTYDIRGEGAGAGYSVTDLNIGGLVVTRPPQRTVSGVDREVSLAHQGNHLSGVSNVAVTARVAYDSGDPINIGAGRVVVTVRPWR